MNPRRVGILVVACGGLMLGAVMLWLSPRDTAEPAPPRANGESMLAAVAKASAMEEAPSSPAPPSSQADASPAREAEKVEVCGTGWIDADADGSVALQPILASAAISKARTHLLSALSSSGDAFGEVARLAVELGSRGEGNVPLRSVESVCKAAPCEATEKDRQNADALYDQLARLAAASSDPRVYGLAFEMCRSRQAAGPCSVLNAAQWARLDGDNGYPWTYLLAEAIAANEPAAIDAALFHIGTASRFDDRRMAVAAMVMRQAGDSEEERFAAEKLGESALNLGPLQSPVSSISQSCSKDALVEPNRRGLCESAASTLAERADSLLAMQIGSKIGRRLEWPPERFEASDALLVAVGEAQPGSRELTDASRPLPPMRRSLDCAAIDEMLRSVQEVASLGEVGYARQWLERSGKTAEYVRRGRERHAILVAHNAAEVAPSASAAHP